MEASTSNTHGSPSNKVALTWSWTSKISGMLTMTLLTLLLICEMLKLLTLRRKQQRIPGGRQLGREVLAGHAECCLPRARPLVLRGPEVQGALAALEVQDGLERHCVHPARIHQPGPESRRRQGCLAVLSGLADLQDRIGHRGRGLQEHREDLELE